MGQNKADTSWLPGSVIPGEAGSLAQTARNEYVPPQLPLATVSLFHINWRVKTMQGTRILLSYSPGHGTSLIHYVIPPCPQREPQNLSRGRT